MIGGRLCVHCARMQPVLDYLHTHRARREEELFEYLRLPSISAQTKHAKDMRATADWVSMNQAAESLRDQINEARK